MNRTDYGRALGWSAIVLLGLALAGIGYALLFSNLMLYDDEGYVLISLKNYARHGGLYNQVYSQYGPFFYLLYDALHRAIGFEFTNTAGRWITLVNWEITAGFCALLVGRLTRSLLWTAFTLSATFIYLWVMINEPVHPGGLITAILAVSVWAGAELWRRGSFHFFSAIAGLVAAALLFTKINVGIFFCASVLVWQAVNFESRSVARALTWTAALLCLVLPIALMGRLLGQTWVQIFVFVFAGTAVSVIATAGSSSNRLTRWSQVATFASTTLGALLFFSLLIHWRGTTWKALLDGVIIAPLKHPGVYFFPVRWRPGTLAVSSLSFAFALLTAARGWWKHERFIKIVVGTRVLVSAATMLAPLELIPTTLAVLGLSFGIPLVWIFAVPLRRTTSDRAEPLWLGLVLTFACLHIYPVAGSQLSWGTFLWLPLVALGLFEAGHLIGDWAINSRFWRLTRYAGAAFVAITTAFMAGRLAKSAWHDYRGNIPLGLPGAESIQVQSEVGHTLQILCALLHKNADVVFSVPGIYSVNLWTDLPTPTLENATHWFSLLTVEQQQRIIAVLDQHEKSVVVVQRDLVDYLARQNIRPYGLLAGWLRDHFSKKLSFGGYEVWNKKERELVPIHLARGVFETTGELRGLDLVFPATQKVVGAIELANIERPSIPLIRFTAENAVARVSTYGDDDSLHPSLETVKPPFAVNGLVQVSLRFPPVNVVGPVTHLLVVVRDPDQKVVDELMIIDK